MLDSWAKMLVSLGSGHCYEHCGDAMTETLPTSLTASQRRLARYGWLVLGYVLAVILWGAYVRASGSGAGCGSHWPLCNGEVIPRAASAQTMIEFTHRITSGLSALAVFAQLIWTFRVFESGSRVRRWALGASGLMVLEALIGAGIVLLEYVADNQSVGRALWMVLHLINTFLLVGALTLTAHVSGGGHAPQWRPFGWPRIVALAAVLGTLFAGASGAVAALGDTLFPPQSLGTALAADLSSTAHVLVKLRIVHPFAALFVGAFLLFSRVLLAGPSASRDAQRWGMWLRVTVLSQLALGLINVLLLAPTWMQLVHLLVADVVWICLVMMLAHALGGPSAREAA
jgi:cytochrome c oxidase assembly protein subunit 15